MTSAIWTIGKPDVFDARIVPAGAAASRSRNTFCLSSRFSGTASTTRSTAAASSNDDVKRESRERGVGILPAHLSALHTPIEPVPPGRDVLQRSFQRPGVEVVANGLVPRSRGHLSDAAPHPALPAPIALRPNSLHPVTQWLERAWCSAESGRVSMSMRQPEAGGFELVGRGEHRLALQQAVQAFNACALDDAVAERLAALVVRTLELQAEEAFDEAFGLAALHTVTQHRLVDALEAWARGGGRRAR